MTSTSARDGILRRVRSVTFVRQSAQLWNSESPECLATSTNREIPATFVRLCDHNVPVKIGKASSAHYTTVKLSSGCTRTTCLWLHLRPCLIPSWRGASRTICECCWSWCIFESVRLLARASWAEKRVWKWMKELLSSTVLRSLRYHTHFKMGFLKRMGKFPQYLSSYFPIMLGTTNFNENTIGIPCFFWPL